MRNRGEKEGEASLTYEEFQEGEYLESENEHEAIKNIAQSVIENNETKEILFRKIDRIVSTYL
jgi:hypothetical protein